MTEQSFREGLEEAVELLSLRHDLLLALTDGPLGKASLTESVDVSRSTVDRGVRELESGGLVEHTDDGYAVTATGRLLLREYDRFADRLVSVTDVADLLADVPNDAPLSTDLFVGAEVVRAREPATHAPGSRVTELLRDATAVRGLAKAHSTEEAEQVYRDLLDRGADVTFVFQEPMYEYVREEKGFGDAFSPDFEATPTLPSVPYGLFVVEAAETTWAVLIVYDDNGEIRGVVVNDHPGAVTWADRTLDHFYERAANGDD